MIPDVHARKSASLTRRGSVGVVVNREKFLVIRRSNKVSAPLKLCFPGGGVEEGETDFDAVIREMREELALHVSPTNLLFRSKTVSGLDLAWWNVDVHNLEAICPNPEEVCDILWLGPAELKLREELLPTNREFLQLWTDGHFEIPGIVRPVTATRMGHVS